MGEFSKQVSERRKHVRLNGGKDYCVICGAHERLSDDHVPPKVATPYREIVQYHVMEVHGVKVNERVKGIRSTNGSRFKTICRTCNSLLGNYDDALGDLCKAVSLGVYRYFSTASHIGTHMRFPCDVASVLRSVAGHMMSATSTEECQQPPSGGPFWQPLREFVLEGKDPSNTHEFYCWFYPFKNSVSAKNVAFSNQGHVAVLTVLAFYPLAFLVVEAGQGIVPSHASKLSLQSDSVSLNLDSRGFAFARFPFHGLEGNQLLLLKEQLCVISVPTDT